MIGWLIKSSFHTFHPLIVIYIRGNFVYHHWDVQNFFGKKFILYKIKYFLLPGLLCSVKKDYNLISTLIKKFGKVKWIVTVCLARSAKIFFFWVFLDLFFWNWDSFAFCRVGGKKGHFCWPGGGKMGHFSTFRVGQGEQWLVGGAGGGVLVARGGRLPQMPPSVRTPLYTIVDTKYYSRPI